MMPKLSFALANLEALFLLLLTPTLLPTAVVAAFLLLWEVLSRPYHPLLFVACTF